MNELNAEELAAAKARGDARMQGPRAKSAHYDAGRNRVIVKLTTGIEIAFAPRDVEGLQHASAEDLKSIEVEAFGLGIHFPTLDADLYIPALLKGILGSRRWMAGRRAATTSGVRDASKPKAAREEGNRSSRRRKSVAR
jgi:uncharacterized protein DUF2442